MKVLFRTATGFVGGFLACLIYAESMWFVFRTEGHGEIGMDTDGFVHQVLYPSAVVGMFAAVFYQGLWFLCECLQRSDH